MAHVFLIKIYHDAMMGILGIYYCKLYMAMIKNWINRKPASSWRGNTIDYSVVLPVMQLAARIDH